MQQFLIKISLNSGSVIFNSDDHILSNDFNRILTRGIDFSFTIGDCINREEFRRETINPQDLLNLKGNFYILSYKKLKDELIISSSVWSILPLYLYKGKKYFFISNRVDMIKSELKNKNLRINKKFILNQFLFNYQFGNDTIYEGIKLLEANTYIEVSGGKVKFNKYFHTEDLFVSKPNKLSQSIDSLSDLFINNTANYIQDESFISFTSGFDGRTLVSIATSLNRKFKTFSFGRLENDDVSIPTNNSKELGLPYLWLDLGGKEYIQKEYLKSAKEYTSLTSGGNGFLYPHILYSARLLQTKTKYLISGIFGSEILRAMHITGAVTSKALVDLFRSKTQDEFLNKTRNSTVLKMLNMSLFETELEEILEECINYKESLPSELSINQKFYLFVFNEIFRKFFGAWVVAQQKYLTVRTPFLDLEFLKELNKTGLAGAYSDFYTDNPFKRLKGQFLYSEIIRKTNKKIYKQKTGKGYSPRDVRNPAYRIKILYPFFKKRLKRNITFTNLDNLSIISGVLNNKLFCEKILKKNDYLNKKFLIEQLDNLTPFTKEHERDLLLMSISLSLFQT